MKVLYYNWVDFEDVLKRGGGVSVYQKNLIDSAVAQGDEVVFLSSGTNYRLFSSRPFLHEVRSSRAGVRKFEIVNSPIMSPGHLAFHDDLSSSPPLEELFAGFLAQNGPFDVIHFNNLEGVPLSFLSLARRQPAPTRVIVSLHNYFPFCPQVNFWFQEKQNCVDYCNGKKCVNCLPQPMNPASKKKEYLLQTLLDRLGVTRIPRLNESIMEFARQRLNRMVKTVKQTVKSVRGLASEASPPLVLLDRAQAAHFAARRANFVERLNRDADHVLAVSQRVAELAVRMGVSPEKVQTAYIGTKFAHASEGTQRDTWNGEGPLSVAYLGYMRPDKGFYFLLKALETMPEKLAARLNLTFAMKITDPWAVDRIKRFAHKFTAVTILDGYTHAALPKILADVDLGVVPVLWEDNLPQVAIEMVGSGVPILTSDLGGAKELLNCPELIFKAGSLKDFYAKLQGVLADPGLLRRAMAGRATLFSTQEHYHLLRERFYGAPAGGMVPRRKTA